MVFTIYDYSWIFVKLIYRRDWLVDEPSLAHRVHAPCS